MFPIIVRLDFGICIKAIRHSARVVAHSLIRVPPSCPIAEHAAPGHRHAHIAVHKDFQFQFGAFFLDFKDFGKFQFPRKDDTADADGLPKLCRQIIGRIRLNGKVNGNFGCFFSHECDNARVGDNQSVGL